MSKFKSLFLGCFCLMLVSNLSAQLEADQSSKKNLPEVFQIGEHEEAFEALSFTYNTSLLAACDENMDMAYKKWLDMLQSLESFGHSNGVDLNGVKMWLNVFWDKNGGNLESSTLLSAYQQGIFPWYNEHDPILWWSPDPRLILDFEDLKIPDVVLV